MFRQSTFQQSTSSSHRRVHCTDNLTSLDQRLLIGISMLTTARTPDGTQSLARTPWQTMARARACLRGARLCYFVLSLCVPLAPPPLRCGCCPRGADTGAEDPIRCERLARSCVFLSCSPSPQHHHRRRHLPRTHRPLGMPYSTLVVPRSLLSQAHHTSRPRAARAAIPT
ncbi:hypothetical protein BC834DRAFT_67503 [Gloeopeniophorella convolvens]|nr:hypothetical protein BC834DRAFT_67503 [Gloeopeniophorella convolvens]